MKHELLINYFETDTAELTSWLEANNYKYDLKYSGTSVTEDVANGLPVGEIFLLLELYTDEAVIATKLAWDVK